MARDAATGELGVAVQSHFFATGALVTWARPGIGAVATQAMVDVRYGPLALERLQQGGGAGAVLEGLLQEDEDRDIRQVAVVSASGEVAAHTGARCIPGAGHRTGDGWSVQANMMLGDTVPDAMAEALDGSTGGLHERLLAALDAAEAAGGDIRGRQSAALVVVAGDASLPPWERAVDVRVDDHPEPLVELRRLVAMRQAYRTGDWRAEAMGDNPELRFWQAIGIGAGGDTAGARALLDPIYAADDRWRELLRRLPGTGVLPDDPDLMAALTDG